VEDGTTIDVPRDPDKGIAIDLSGLGVDVVVAPLDGSLADFVTSNNVAIAQGDGYSTIAQPTEDGEFRMAVVLDDASAPRSMVYDFALEPGTAITKRSDGGYDFADATGKTLGGLGAPWGIDANGNLVDVSYSFAGGRLTRTIEVDATTAFPVVANWCLFGKNPNGSCRNPIRGGSNWIQDNWRGLLISISFSTLFRLTCFAAVGGFTVSTSGAAAAAYPTLIAACTAVGAGLGRIVSGYTHA
jgi:hypothetical protein